MAKIDPAFQAAPVLQDTYNPVELASKQHAEKFQLQKAKYEEQQKATAEGLNKLMLNLKGWEDKAGFQELLGRQQKAIDGFMALSRKGMNLVNPKSAEEVMAYKALTDYHAQTKQLADTWTQQKGIYDLYHKAIEEDSKLSPDEQKIDHAGTEKNIQDVLANNSIEGRAGKLQDLIVSKPTVGDVHKYVKDNLDMITKPDKVQMPYTDPNTGQQGSIMNEVVTPQIQKKQVADLRNLYNTAPSKIKNGIKQARKEDPENDSIMTDQDYFVSMYNPKFKQQMIDKLNVRGGGNYSLMNQEVKVTPPTKQTNEIPLGDKTLRNHYDFNVNKTLIGVPISNFKGAQVLMGGKWMPVGETGGLADANLNYYDADTDSFIFTTKANAMDAGAFKGQALSIPRTSLDAGFSDLPVKDENGKTIKVKDLHPQVAGRNSVLKNSGIQWK
jgi:hypothetical protein